MFRVPTAAVLLTTFAALAPTSGAEAGQPARPIKIARSASSKPRLFRPHRAAQMFGAPSSPSCYDANFNPEPCTIDMEYYGGHVLANVKVYSIYWSSDVDSTTKSQMGAFYQDVTNSSHMDWLNEYNTDINIGTGDSVGGAGTNQQLGRGVFGGDFVITPVNGNTSLTDADFGAELDAQIAAGHLPEPDANTIFMLHFPAGFSLDDGFGALSCVDFCAYHSTWVHNGKSAFYGVMPDQNADGCENGCGAGTALENTCSTSSHELFEAITDGEIGLAQNYDVPIAWYDAGQDGQGTDSQGEVGDMCNQNADTFSGLSGTTWTVQQIYSKLQDGIDGNGCVTTRFDTNDFSVSMNPNKASVTVGDASGVAIPIITTKKSTAPTLALSVDPASLPAGVHATFSKTSVTAGATGSGASTLTLTADAGIASVADAVVVVIATPNSSGSGSGAKVHTAALLLQVTGGSVSSGDFTVSVPAATTGLVPGAAGQGVTVTTTHTNGGTAPSVTLSVSGLPTGVTGSFNPATVAAGTSSTLTLTAASGAAVASARSYTVTGTAGSLVHTVSTGQVQVDGLPTVTISSPANNATVSGTVSIGATATAGSGSTLTAMAFKVDGNDTFDTTSSPLSYSWSTSGVSAGAHTLTVVATDADGGSATATAHVTVQAPPTNDFTISLSPSAGTAIAGLAGAIYTVSTASTSGTAETVTFSASGLHSGLTASFNPTSATAGGSSTLTITAAAGTAAFSGSGFSVVGTTTSVAGGHSAPGTISVPLNDFGIAISPGSGSAVAGGASATYTITTSVTGGAPETVTLGTSGLHAGVNATFTPPTVTAGGTSTLTLSAPSGTAAFSASTFTATGTSTSVPGGHGATATIAVTTPPANDFSLSVSPGSGVTSAGGTAAQYTVTTAVASGTAETVTFSATGLPAGLTASFNPTSVTAGGSTTMSVTAAAGTSAMSATAFQVVGTSPSVPAPGYSVAATIAVATAPTISLTAPSAGNVSGKVTISATATLDASATLTRIDLLDGSTVLGGSSTSTSVSVQWDTALASNGTHTIGARVTDSNGLTGTAATVSVTVSNVVASDFTVALASGSVSVAAGGSNTLSVATTAVGAAETVSLTVSGLPTGVTGSFSSGSVTAGGSSTLTLSATSSAAAGTSTVTVSGASNGTTHTATAQLTVTTSSGGGLSVAITSPSAAATISGSVQIDATATLAAGTTLARIDFLVDGFVIGTDTHSPGVFVWDTTVSGAGAHDLTAKAYDSGGNNATSRAVTVTVTAPAVAHNGCASFGGGELLPILGLLALGWRRRARAQ